MCSEYNYFYKNKILSLVMWWLFGCSFVVNNFKCLCQGQADVLGLFL